MRVSIDIGDRVIAYEDLAITCTGTKYTNALQADAQITIANLDTDVRDFILTEGTPFLRDREQAGKTITVEVGRESTGLDLLYVGNIFRATISNPPDQVITIRAIQRQAAKGRIVQANYPGQVPMSTIVEQVIASIDTNLACEFEATDRMISDFSFSGGALSQLQKIQQFGNIDTWIDNNTVYVIDRDNTVLGFRHVLTPRNGMVGIPKPTEQGIQVTMMYDRRVVVGGELDIESTRYPSLTGRYKIYKLTYNLTNRDTPFYLTADANRLL